MTWFMVVYIMINGIWIQGDEIDGFGAMARQSKAHCQESIDRANELNKNGIAFGNKHVPIKFVCEQHDKTPIMIRGQST
ncbi:hypothetical protein [Terasakiella pusilla]|uniref:hypothetical protein n=1 Tax=Terasakiella pusilla TaxID=64973 RepID=UPI003AA87A80